VNFDTDPHVRACYNFEAGAITADAISGGTTACGSHADTLTNDGGVVANAAISQEGAASADYTSATVGVGLRCNANCPDWDVSSVNRFTFAIWIRPSSIAAIESPLIGRIGSSVFQYYGTILNSDSRVHLMVTDAACVPFTGVDIASTNPVSLAGDWTHVAGTYDIDTGEARLYINGKLDGTSHAISGALCSGASITWNGVGENGGGAFPWDYRGDLDEARIFDRALSAAEICTLCKFGAGGASAHACACP
jgi:hypothetical protein